MVIPTYNHGGYVVEAVRSVLDQGWPDLELVVVNDGSPDGTADVLSPFVEAGSLRYVEQPNLGQAAARNAGLALCSGRYVGFLDDDDAWPKGSLAARIDYLDSHPGCCAVAGSVEVFGDGEGKIVDYPMDRSLETADFVNGACLFSPGQALIRRSALDQVGGFDPKIWGADDWDLWIRLSHLGKMGFLDLVTLRYRKHAENASKDYRRLQANALKVYRRHGPGLWSRPVSYLIGPPRVADFYRRLALEAWRERHRLSDLGRYGTLLALSTPRLACRRLTRTRT